MSHSRAFDFCAAMRPLCVAITQAVPEFDHIDMRRVVVAVTQARNGSQYGLFASLTPLRFEEGKQVTQRRGRTYAAPRYLDSQGREMLYILSFCLPRFQDQAFDEKLITIFHELWHISPAFNGDIRRHAGRCYAHTGSQKQYDAHMAKLVNQWLALDQPDETLLGFLRHDFNTLRHLHGQVVGTKLRRPRLIPVSKPSGGL
jgi:predicted metallopeptidase